MPWRRLRLRLRRRRAPRHLGGDPAEHSAEPSVARAEADRKAKQLLGGVEVSALLLLYLRCVAEHAGDHGGPIRLEPRRELDRIAEPAKRERCARDVAEISAISALEEAGLEA